MNSIPESFIAINEPMAMQLYANYILEYANLVKENGNTSKCISFKCCFKDLYSETIGEGNTLIIVKTSLFMNILTNSCEDLMLHISAAELKRISEKYKSHQLICYKNVERLVQPYINRIDIVLQDTENVKVSVKFCKIHFDVERVYSHILEKLLGEKC